MSTPGQREQSRRAAAQGRAARTESKGERIERYAQLLRGGYTPVQACWELHITRRTGHRYEEALRIQQLRVD